MIYVNTHWISERRMYCLGNKALQWVLHTSYCEMYITDIILCSMTDFQILDMVIHFQTSAAGLADYLPSVLTPSISSIKYSENTWGYLGCNWKNQLSENPCSERHY